MASNIADELDSALESMTTEEKLGLIDKIWGSISMCPPELEAPGWLEQLLSERRARIESGETKISDWEEAKARLQSLCK